jgi:cytosine/adenosine deaminase-related metal-dependent hydrolase
VRVEIDAAGRIARLAREPRQASDRTVDILLPGLVDAHAHLELGPLPEAPRRFVPWLRAVIAERASASADAPLRQARDSLRLLIASGVTAVGDIDSLGGGHAALRDAGLAGRAYAELLGFDVGSATAGERLARAQRPADGDLLTGLSPHAPYSVSPALFEAAARSGQWLAVHCAETEEEAQFVRDGSGPLRDLLVDLGKWDGSFRGTGRSALRSLRDLGLRGPRVLWIHAQHLESGDLDLLADGGSPVVICPGTIEWFGRPAPEVPAMLRRGIRVALGTDSLASNATLDGFREMALLRRMCPDLEPGVVLRMATAAAADALGIEAGRLRPGRRFDAVALGEPPERAPAALEDWITGGEPRSRRTFLRGRLAEA